MSNQASLNSVPQSILAPDAPIASDPIGQPSVPEQAPAAVPKKDLDSTRFAHLSKKEAALVKEREAFKKEMEVFKQQQLESDKYRKAWEMVNEIAELQKTDAVAAMKKAGFSDTDLLNYLSQAQDTSTPEERASKIAKSEIDKFKSEQAKIQEENEKKSQELKKSEEDKTILKFKNDIGSFISKDTDKYEYLNFYGESAQDIVYETISTILQDSGEMISIDEAAQLVENYYEEQDKAMNSLKKRGVSRAVNPESSTQNLEDVIRKQPISAPKINTPTRVESKQFVDNKTPTKTLTNRMTPTSASSVPQDLTPEQNKQAVLEKYKNLMRR